MKKPPDLVLPFREDGKEEEDDDDDEEAAKFVHPIDEASATTPVSSKQHCSKSSLLQAGSRKCVGW